MIIKDWISAVDTNTSLMVGSFTLEKLSVEPWVGPQLKWILIFGNLARLLMRKKTLSHTTLNNTMKLIGMQTCLKLQNSARICNTKQDVTSGVRFRNLGVIDEFPQKRSNRWILLTFNCRWWVYPSFDRNFVIIRKESIAAAIINNKESVSSGKFLYGLSTNMWRTKKYFGLIEIMMGISVIW